jgi:hypothetical protein
MGTYYGSGWELCKGVNKGLPEERKRATISKGSSQQIDGKLKPEVTPGSLIAVPAAYTLYVVASFVGCSDVCPFLLQIWLLKSVLDDYRSTVKSGFTSPVYTGVGLGRVVRKVRQHPDDHEFESQRWQ